MEAKNLLTLAITLTVGIILAGSLLMPVISDATETERTITNIGDYYVLENPSEVTITFADDVLTINGEIIPAPSSANGYGVSVISIGNGVLRYTPNGQLIKWGSITPYSSVPITEATITISNGALSGTVTYSGSTTPASISATLGDDYYVLQKTKQNDILTLSTSKTYVLEDTIVSCNGVTNVDSNAVYGTCVFDVVGSIKDGFTVKAYNRNAGTEITSNLGIDNITPVYTKVDGYKDLYLLEKVTFTTTTDAETPVTANLQYQYFVAPSEINAELANHLSPGQIAIMNALPVLVIVALVVMAAGSLYLKRDD